MKRTFDFIFAFLGLIVLIPLFLVISIIIKLNSKGPVFFQQKRVGKDGRLFILYKFRSMLVMESSGVGIFEPGNVSRITKVGRFLRKTKIDELPQLFNVLIGDMSLVGPRPEVEKWIYAFPQRWKQILKIRPGITDNASIEFRNEEYLLARSADPEKTYRETILPKKLDFYESYVINHSFFGDLKMILNTFIHILKK